MKLYGVGLMPTTSDMVANTLTISALPATLSAVFTHEDSPYAPSGILSNTLYYIKKISGSTYKLFNSFDDAVAGTSEIVFIDNVSFNLTLAIGKATIISPASFAATSIDNIYHCATFPAIQSFNIIDTCTITYDGTEYILPLTGNRKFRSHWVYIGFLWTQFEVTVADKVVSYGTDPTHLSIKLEIKTFPTGNAARFVAGVTAGVVTSGDLFYPGYTTVGSGFWAPPVFNIQTGSYPSIITGATAEGIIGTGGSLTGVTITNGGSGYPSTLFTASTSFDFVRSFKYYHAATSEYYAPQASFPMSGTLLDDNSARALPVSFVFSGSQTMPASARVYLKNAWMGKHNRYGYPDTLIDPVAVVSNSSITLSGLQTIDGVALAAGDRVLIKNQSSGVQNGIYVVSAGSWSRSTDTLVYRLFVMVLYGSQAGKGYWITSGVSGIFIGISSITISPYTIGVIEKVELGDIDVVCAYDLATNRYYSDVLTYYEISGRIIFSAEGGYPLPGEAPFMKIFENTSIYPVIDTYPIARVHISMDDYDGIHTPTLGDSTGDPAEPDPSGGFFTGQAQSTTFFDTRFYENYDDYFGALVGLRPPTTPAPGAEPNFIFLFSEQRRAIKAYQADAQQADIYRSEYYIIFAHGDDSHISSFLTDP